MQAGRSDRTPDVLDVLDAPAFMTLAEKSALGLAAASAGNDAVIVEVGSYHGGSARLLRMASQPGAVVHSADIKDRMGSSKPDLPGLLFHLGDAMALAGELTKPISLLFLDGDHSYHGLRRDLHALSPFMADRAVLAIHDVDAAHMGARVFVDSLVECGALTGTVRVDSLVLGHLRRGSSLPEASDAARAVHALMEAYDNAEFINQGRAAWANAPLPRDAFTGAPGVMFVGKGYLGEFIRDFHSLPQELFIDSAEAPSTNFRYLVCSYALDSIMQTLTAIKGVHPSLIHPVRPHAVSRMILDDLSQDGAKCARIAKDEHERSLLRLAFSGLDAATLREVHNSGFLYQFFTRFNYSL